MSKVFPPYSPDYHPIELTRNVLKAWIRRHFGAYSPTFDGDFGHFLRWAIEKGQCDRVAMEHFCFSAAGYVVKDNFDFSIKEGILHSSSGLKRSTKENTAWEERGRKVSANELLHFSLNVLVRWQIYSS